MKNLLFFLATFCLAANMVSCNGQMKSDDTKQIDLESVYKQNIKDSILATGWYYIMDSNNGFERQLDKTDEIYFIDPKPILVKAYFDKIEISEVKPQGQYEGYLGLSIRINKKYSNIWAEATEKSIGKRLGLIIDNKLVNAPLVNAKIEEGMSSLNRGIYDKGELESFKKQLE